MNTHHTWNTRAETDTDTAAVHAINAAAFDTTDEADLVDALQTDPSWIEGLPIVSTTPTEPPSGTRY